VVPERLCHLRRDAAELRLGLHLVERRDGLRARCVCKAAWFGCVLYGSSARSPFVTRTFGVTGGAPICAVRFRSRYARMRSLDWTRSSTKRPAYSCQSWMHPSSSIHPASLSDLANSSASPPKSAAAEISAGSRAERSPVGQ
jgi:hypothetical protein